MAHFANDGASFFVPVVIDILAVAYGVGAVLITASLVLFWGSMAVGAIVLGPVIDRKGLQVSGMSLGLLVLSLGLIFSSIALDNVLVPFFLVISSAVSGLGASFYHPTGAALLQSNYGSAKLGRYLGINGSAGSVGRALYPSLLLLVGAAFVSNALSVQVFGALGMAFSAAVFVGLRGAQGASRGSGKKAEELPGLDGQGKKASAAGSRLSGAIVLLTVISFVRSVAFYGIISWIPEYMSFERGAGAGFSLGAMTTILYSGPIVGQLMFGKLVEDYDKRMVLSVSTVFSALFLYLYLYTSGTLSLALLALFGFTNLSGFPIFMSMTSDYVPRKASTTSNALVWNLGNTGGRAAGPLVVGLLTFGSYGNLPFAFEVSLVAGLASAAMGLMLPKASRTSEVQMTG